MLQIRSINKIVKNTVSEDITLYKGDGYFYFQYDSDSFKGLIFETHSVYVNSLNDLDLDRWLEEATILKEKARKIYNDMPYPKG